MTDKRRKVLETKHSQVINSVFGGPNTINSLIKGMGVTGAHDSALNTVGVKV